MICSFIGSFIQVRVYMICSFIGFRLVRVLDAG